MDSPGAAVGRRRGTPKVNAEDQALDLIAKEVCLTHFYFYFFYKCSSKLFIVEVDSNSYNECHTSIYCLSKD